MSETEVTTEGQFDNNDDLDAFTTEFFGQKPVASVETKTEAEPVEGEAQAAQDPADKEGGDTDAQKPEADPNADPDAEYKETPPKKKTVQDRIDELVKQREDVKRESDQRIADLRKEFEDKFAALAPKPAAKADEPTPLDTNADGTDKYPLGEFDPQYIRDLTRHTLEQERAQVAIKTEEESRAREQTRAQEALTSDWNTRLEAAKAEYPDLVEKATPMLNGFGGLDPTYAGYLSTVLMSMDKGPDVLYYLSNHPDEATTIVNSGAQRATLALGRIEAKFLEADAQKLVAKPKVSKAPPPAPVQARGTNGAFITVAPDTDDLDAFASEFFVKKRR